MIKNKLVNFVVRRIALFYLLSVLISAFFSNRAFLIAGLTAGALLGIIRFISNAWIFSFSADKKSIKNSAFLKAAIFIANQAVLFLLLFLFNRISLSLLLSFAGGLLLAPFTIILNNITEVMGLTKNKFYLE